MNGLVAVKEAVLPWSRFRTVDGDGLDIALGPEMRSTGEVMGIDVDFAAAFGKSQAAALVPLSAKGRVLVSAAPRCRPALVFPLRVLADLGFDIVATDGTAEVLDRGGVPVAPWAVAVPELARRITDGDFDLIVDIPGGAGDPATDAAIRSAAAAHGLPCLTTVPALSAAVHSIESLRRTPVSVRSLQDYHRSRASAGDRW